MKYETLIVGAKIAARTTRSIRSGEGVRSKAHGTALRIAVS